jgi:uncharacterized membrane protein YfcA
LEPQNVLFVVLGAIGAAFAIYWVAGMVRAVSNRATAPAELSPGPPSPIHLAIGFVTDFLDTLGIGSFATTTNLFKLFRNCHDRVIPGTLNVGHTLPTVLQAYIYIGLIKVDTTTLVSMIVAAVAGSWIGAGVVAGLSKRKIQLGMGVTLLVAAGFLVLRQPASEEGTLALEGARLWIGLIVNFILGALMTLGIGLYAPCMILVMLLGMSGKAAFPIMMGSCAFLMPVASMRFIQKQSYSIRASLGLAIGGLPAVYIAAHYVTDLPFEWIKWLVVTVVSIAAIVMLSSAFSSKADSNSPQS